MLWTCAPKNLLRLAILLAVLLASTAARTELLRVALSTKDFGYLPLYVGMRTGLFAQENLDVQWIQVGSNVVVTALLAGEIDVAGIAGSAMRAAARGAPLKAVLFPYNRSLFVLMGAPSIKRIQDLKGKVIGTTGPGATTELAASMVLQSNGMDPKKDVTFMNIGGAETSVLAMRNGTIHARAFNPDAALLLRKQGFTELGVLADMGPWPWAGYSTSDAHLAQRRDKLKRWMRAMVKSLQFIQSRREETVKVAQAEFNHPPDIIEGAADICRRAIDPQHPGAVSDEVMRRNIELTITQPLKLSATPELQQLVDFSLLREIHKELAIPRRRP
jgi:NitT/TauT family transport system substrate-binding protein